MGEAKAMCICRRRGCSVDDGDTVTDPVSADDSEELTTVLGGGVAEC